MPPKEGFGGLERVELNGGVGEAPNLVRIHSPKVGERVEDQLPSLASPRGAELASSAELGIRSANCRYEDSNWILYGSRIGRSDGCSDSVVGRLHVAAKCALQNFVERRRFGSGTSSIRRALHPVLEVQPRLLQVLRPVLGEKVHLHVLVVRALLSCVLARCRWRRR